MTERSKYIKGVKRTLCCRRDQAHSATRILQQVKLNLSCAPATLMNAMELALDVIALRKACKKLDSSALDTKIIHVFAQVGKS